MFEHDYAVLGGANRTKVGRYLGALAAFISATTVYFLLSSVRVAEALGIPPDLPPSILSLAMAGSVFAGLYWAFDRFAWRWRVLGGLLRVPNLSGEWKCAGRTLDQDGSVRHVWDATVTVTQSWDKLRVRLKTSTSRSNSVSAALICDPSDGHKLLYHYVNDPRIGEPDLKSHRGFAEVVFSKDMTSAEGEYVNGFGRSTFGTMKLTRS